MIGENIKRLRKLHHLTLGQLANKVGVDESTVCYWEKGESEPRKQSKLKMCELFGITQSELYK